MIELDKVNWKETEDGRWLAYQEDGTQITGCCKGKRKSAGTLEDSTKLSWMYYEDYLKEAS